MKQKNTDAKRAEKYLEKIARKYLKVLGGGVTFYWFINVIKKLLGAQTLVGFLEDCLDAESAEDIYRILKADASDQMAWEASNILFDCLKLANHIASSIGYN